MFKTLRKKYILFSSEVDFVCMDIVPRHHSIVRYRIGKFVGLVYVFSLINVSSSNALSILLKLIMFVTDNYSVYYFCPVTNPSLYKFTCMYLDIPWHCHRQCNISKEIPIYGRDSTCIL